MVSTFLIASLSQFSSGKAAPGFFFHPGQTFANPNPVQYPYSSYFGINPYIYSHPLPVQRYQVPIPFPQKGCTNYLGFTVPCYVGGSSVLIENPAASITPIMDNAASVAEDITPKTKSDVDVSPAIIEARSVELEDNEKIEEEGEVDLL